jgi:hypothetical protein
MREDFVHSIFELADMWTESVHRAEYADFLERGYSHVFSQHLDLDALNFPPTWRRYLDEDSSDEDSEASPDVLIDMPENAVMEYAVDVHIAKLAHDAKCVAEGRPFPGFDVVALEILECREFPNERGAHKSGCGRWRRRCADLTGGTPGSSSSRGSAASSRGTGGSGRSRPTARRSYR